MSALVCCHESFISKLIEPQVWFPVLSGFVAYFAQQWIRMVLRRKSESRRAVIYLGELAEEVSIGCDLFEYMFLHGGQPSMRGGRPNFMTRECWNEGHKSAIPDDIFERIINVSHYTKKCDVTSLRSHLKNYYVCICGQYRRIVMKEVPFLPMEYYNSLEGARMVKRLVADCKVMMEENSRRVVWPW